MKIFTIILLAVFGLSALVGLIVFATFNSSGKGGSGISDVVVWGTLPEDTLKKTLQNFTRTYPAFTKMTYVYKDPEVFIEDFTEALSVGKGPDLLLISHDFILQNEEKIRAIGGNATKPRAFRDTYIEATEPLLVSGGALMMPLLVDPLVMYYNRPLLNGAGVAVPPASWEAVAALSERMTKRAAGEARIDIATIPFGTYSNVPYAHSILSLLFLQAGSSIMTRSQSGSFDVSLVDSRTTSALRFYTDFSNPLKSVYSWNTSLPSAFTQFLAGDVAFYIAPFSERLRILAGAPNLNMDMTQVPNPQTRTTPLTTGTIYGLVLPASSGSPADAMVLATALSQKEVVLSLAERFGMVPVRRDAIVTENQTDPFLTIGHRSALITKIWLSPSPQVMEAIFGTMVDSVRSGLNDANGAVGIAAQALKDEVK